MMFDWYNIWCGSNKYYSVYDADDYDDDDDDDVSLMLEHLDDAAAAVAVVFDCQMTNRCVRCDSH